ncbi:MAG TPA: CIA30 family protein [Xenococcaceae cyanobacterium]
MKQSNSRWSLARFWQTLSYFKILPGSNFWHKIFQLKNQQSQINHSVMKNILFVNHASNFSQMILQNLIAKNYDIKLLTCENSLQESNIDAAILASYTWNSYASENLKTKILLNTNTIVYVANLLNNSDNDLLQNLASLLDDVTNYFPNSQEKCLFDFTNYNTSIKELWGAVDDVVMGGVSESQIQLSENKAVFFGNVSTNNNGGFASVRTRNFYPVMNLGDYEGIELKVKGDGKRYKFIMRCEGTWDGIGYCYSFDTVKDKEQIIKIKFADLIPVFRAKTVAEADSFNSNQVYSMQLMLSKFEYDGQLNPAFEPGSFKLEVSYIKAYSQTFQPHFILVSFVEPKYLDSAVLSAKLEQENLVINSGINYTIIRNYNLSELKADKRWDISANTNQAEKLTEICLENIESASAVNKIFEI